MPCNATSQLTNAPSVPLQVTMPTNNAQWAVFVQRLQAAINATRDAANRTGVNVVPAAYAVYDAAALPALSINGASAALDGTKSQFGKASLKLTATAATVTVSFTGNPIAINAYQRWIESVYIQSSRTSIAGTLAVVTPAASYPVDISGTLLPATWGRLYGDCSLVADNSTQATMTLTLTGCSVGDTFNLEGWQLEQAAGNTNLPSAFVNSAAPGSQDTLPDGSGFVRLSSSHASGNVAYNYRGVWSSTTTYVTGDEVVYSGSYWLCLTGNTNNAPAQGNGDWQVVGAYNNYQGAWSSTVTYYAGQESTYSGNYWVATATNTNSAPSTSNANWVIAGPQNLDHVADGTGRFAVVNGAGFKGVSSVDQNNRALIDATQAGHVGAWSLDSRVADGTAYLRMPAANMDANRRGLVDFSQSGHINKTLDNIADTANFQRVGTGYADTSGRIVNLWDGTAARSAVDTWDGANRARTGLQSSGVLVAGLHPVDNLKDGTYARTLGAAIQNGVPIPPLGGKNLVTNGSFSSNVTGTPVGSILAQGAPATDGWFVSAQEATHRVIYEASSSGTDILIRLLGGSSIPANSFISSQVSNVKAIPVEGGVPFALSVTRGTAANVALPSGITVTLRTDIAWLRGDGSASSTPTSILDAGGNRVTYGPAWLTGNVPSDAVTASLQLQSIVQNTTGAAIALPAGLPADMRWGNVSLVLANNLDYEAVDGAVNGRMAMADVYNVGGANRVGLRIPGSGHQLGDQFNSPPIASANLRSTWTGQTISYSATAGSPATATISVTAATLLAGDASKAYNAMSVGVSGTGGSTVTYYLYFDDPGYAGGAQTLVATTTGSNIYGANGRVYVGSIPVTFPTSGSGSGGGSGGGGACVALGAYGPRGRFDRETRCVDTPDGAVSVRNLKTSHQKCVRVEYDNGTVLTCSEDAPLMDGQRKVLAIDALGETLDTSKGSSRVRSVESAGILEVVSIDAGDVAYYASNNPDGPFALHHNKIIP